MRALMWFRADLRLGDNPALHAACEAGRVGVVGGGGVVGVFVICPAQWAAHDWSDARVDLILRTLEGLSRDLRAHGVPLKILEVPGFGGVPGALLSLAEATGCGAIYFNREHEVNEVARDEAVRRAFEDSGRPVRAFTDQVCFEPGTLLTKAGGWYTVFTPFKRRWRERMALGEGASPVGMPVRPVECGIEPDPIPQGVAGFDRRAAPVSPGLWPAGEAEARERLGRFLEQGAGGYAQRRNIPSIDGTSALSPYLAVGSISPARCVHDAAARNGGRFEGGEEGVVAWIDELVWREFYRHVMVGFPRVCKHQPFKLETRGVAWSADGEAFERWRTGRTGFPIVDAGMRQLAQTGWMHNRVRMVTAMFLTKDLLIDWRLGERHFMRTLIDGDLASNNGGWQWSASTGTDAQPYFRIFNPTEQGRRFDPDGAYIRRYVPELGGLSAPAIHEPSRAGLFDSGRLGYPGPMVDHAAARARALGAFRAVSGGA